MDLAGRDVRRGTCRFRLSDCCNFGYNGPVDAPVDEVEIQLDASGTVTVFNVAKAQGQSHETTFAQIVARALEIPLEKVKIEQCPPGTKLRGNGTGGSRSTVGAGSVCHLAAQKLIEEGKALAALEMHVEPSQVNYGRGEFRSGDSDRVVKLADLAKERTLSYMAEGKFGSTYPNGCHIAEVEVDPDTGHTEVVRSSPFSTSWMRSASAGGKTSR